MYVIVHKHFVIHLFNREDVNSTKDVFLIFEKNNFFMRIDERRLPTTFKCATVSKEELISLRKIKNIIRCGRVAALEKDKIVFKDKRFVLFS